MKLLILMTLASFFLSIALGWVLIPLMRRMKLAQPIKEEVLSLHQKKVGTPTLGGLIFILPTIFLTVIAARITAETLLLLCALILFSMVGLIDDSTKLFYKSNDGVSAKRKMILIFIVSCLLVWMTISIKHQNSSILLPVVNYVVELGPFFIPFLVLFYLTVTNSVNLTDGLDGLAATISVVVLCLLTLIALYLGRFNIALFCGILSGGLLGFLRFNAFPACVIMGDTGSLALGGVIAGVAILLRVELLILIAGGIYLLEATSSALQIIWFKLSGRRIFKMAPIHHSFELSGYTESKIVSLFTIATALLCMLAFAALP